MCGLSFVKFALWNIWVTAWVILSSLSSSAIAEPIETVEPAERSTVSSGAEAIELAEDWAARSQENILALEPESKPELEPELEPISEIVALLDSVHLSAEQHLLERQLLSSELSHVPNSKRSLPPKNSRDSIAQVLSTSPADSNSELASELAPAPVEQFPVTLSSVNAGVSLEQVTSVSQLSDVQPTDWAYQALQSLVERYGCIVGYPDGTYRGQSAMTRYEFAAGLAACLDRMSELIASATSDLATQEDLATLQRLQEEFAAELATLRGRVDALEERVATLEEQQFSTTTTLRGNVWFNLTQAFPAGEILAERSLSAPDSAFAPPTRDADNRPSRVERDQPQLTGSYYTWLTLTTSFTGRDSLVAQLVVGNANSPANQLVSAGFFNSWGTPFLDQTGTPNANTFILRELFYSFPIGEAVQVDIGPRLNYYRYFDGNPYTFYLTGATSYNSTGSTLLNAIDRGTGLVVRWQIFDPLSLTLGYLAENTEFLNAEVFNTSSDPNDGLFNSSNTLSAQLAFSPSRRFNLRLIYARTNLKPYNGFIGGAVGEPLPYGYADDGFGGTLHDSGSDTFVANFDWTITDWLGIFGRYSYARLDINPVNPDRSGGDIRVQAFQVGLGFPDLGKAGAMGVLSFVVPHDYLEGRRFLLSGGGDGGTQYELEASYRYPLTDHIALVPSFYTIWNANNFDSNPTVYVGNMRMQFTF